MGNVWTSFLGPRLRTTICPQVRGIARNAVKTENCYEKERLIHCASVTSEGHPIIPARETAGCHVDVSCGTVTKQKSNLCREPLRGEFKGRAHRGDVIARRKSPGTNFVCAGNWIMCHARTRDLRLAVRVTTDIYMTPRDRRLGRRKLAGRPLIADRGLTIEDGSHARTSERAKSKHEGKRNVVTIGRDGAIAARLLPHSVSLRIGRKRFPSRYSRHTPGVQKKRVTYWVGN